MNQPTMRHGASPFSDTPVSLGVIVLCAVIYLTSFQPLNWMLWPLETGVFAPYQLVSYGFLHGSFNHLFFNMFAVWMFGTPLERNWGSRRFATLTTGSESKSDSPTVSRFGRRDAITASGRPVHQR